MDRFLVDTMILDKVVDTPHGLELVRRLTEAGHLDILVTHVQEDQVADAPVARSKKLALVPRTQIPTSEFVVGVSRLGRARLGSGEPFESLRGTKRHTHDALIAATADYERVPLVTEDARLARRARAQGLDVWDWARFEAHLQALDPAQSGTPTSGETQADIEQAE